MNIKKNVLSAFRDVEDALSAVSAASSRVLELERHTKITSDALRRAGTDYKLGLTGYLPVIEAQKHSKLLARRPHLGPPGPYKRYYSEWLAPLAAAGGKAWI